MPVVGHNIGNYDLPASQSSGFMAALLGYEAETTEESNPIESVIPKGASGVKCLKTKNYVVLDVLNYCAPNTPLTIFQRMYLGKSAKGHLPYELNTDASFEASKERFTRTHFDSLLKNHRLTDEEWAWVVGEMDYCWTTAPENPRRLFKQRYVEADVAPSCKAVQVMLDTFYADYGISLFKDCLGIPSAGKLVQARLSAPGVWDTPAHTLPPVLCYTAPTDDRVEQKIVKYLEQDTQRLVKQRNKAAEENNSALLEKWQVTQEQVDKDDEDAVPQELLDELMPLADHISTTQTETLIETLTDACFKVHARQHGRCIYCHAECGEDWTLERIFNYKGHTADNCVVACRACNVERADKMSATYFWKLKRLHKYAEVHPMAYVLGTDGDETGQRLAMVQALRQEDNMNGGISWSTCRAATGGERLPPKPSWTPTGWQVDEAATGEVCRMVGVVDVKSEYPSTWIQGSPCGKGVVHATAPPTLLDDVRAGTAYGYVGCDLKVSEDLYDHFSILPPLFCKRTLTYTDYGTYNQDALRRAKGDAAEHYKEKKLIPSMVHVGALIPTPMLKMYLEMGCEASAPTCFYEFVHGTPFKHFTNTMIAARDRYKKSAKQCGVDADTTTDEATKVSLLAQKIGWEARSEIAKLLMNSPFGKQIEDGRKYSRAVPYMSHDPAEVFKRKNDKYYHSTDVFTIGSNKLYSVHVGKRKVVETAIPHVGKWVMDTSKCILLDFVYNVLDKTLPRNRWQIMGGDTDSLIIAFGHPDALSAKDAGDLRAYVPDHLKALWDVLAARSLIPATWSVEKGEWCEGTGVPGQMNLEARMWEAIFASPKCYSLISKHEFQLLLDGQMNTKTGKALEADQKIRIKGAQKRNQSIELGTDATRPRIQHLAYRDVVGKGTTIYAINQGFHAETTTQPDGTKSRDVYTYRTEKVALSPFYGKGNIYHNPGSPYHGVVVLPFI